MPEYMMKYCFLVVFSRHQTALLWTFRLQFCSPLSLPKRQKPTMPCKGISFFWGYTNALPWNFTSGTVLRVKHPHLTAWRGAANVAISALQCKPPLAFLCVLSLNASPESCTQLCKHLPRSSKQLLSTQADGMSSRSLCTAQQSNKAGFDHCYTFKFTPELYFPKTQKTLLIKVIPHCCFSVGMWQQHADCRAK